MKSVQDKKNQGRRGDPNQFPQIWRKARFYHADVGCCAVPSGGSAIVSVKTLCSFETCKRFEGRFGDSNKCAEAQCYDIFIKIQEGSTVGAKKFPRRNFKG